MKIHAIVLIGCLNVGIVATASAATPGPAARGPEAGVRFGVAVPTGSIQGGGGNGSNLDAYAGSALPFVLEAGYRFDPSLFLGARFQYAFPQLKAPVGSCNNTISCSGSVMQLGIEGVYRFLADRTFAPWAGLGFGYEWASADWDRANGNGFGATYRGLQGLIQAGGDGRVSSQLVLGPFIEVAVGRYDTTDDRTRVGNVTTETTTDITNTAVHTWISIGMRGAFGF
jgi:hypothetical protein